MNTYSIVHTYREHSTGKTRYLSIKGDTFATVEAAYAEIMRCRADYKPGDRRYRYSVRENYYPIDLAYGAMGRWQRVECDEAVQVGADRV